MSITQLYNKTVSTQRLADVAGSRKEQWATNIASLECAIQSQNAEHSELHGAAFYQGFKMWCPSGTDILTGDKVIDGNTTYHVRAVAEKSFGDGGIDHLVVVLVKGE
jgi:hypothetical protein